MGPAVVAALSVAIVGGTTDTTDAAVVSIGAPADAAVPELCSGVVIAPRVVLTAGHCTRLQSAADLTVGVGSSAGAPLHTLQVADVVTYPGFSGSDADVAAGLDLGAVLLAEDAGVTPAALLADDSAAIAAGTMTAVGFGESSAGNLDTRGTRRSAQVHVDSACSALVAFGDASFNACHGDSGGPLLAPAPGGGVAVAAIVSFGDMLNCATPSYAVRVDRYASWIAAVVASAPSPPDAGACTVCPPRAGDCAFDAGADALADGAAEASAGAAPFASYSVSGGCSVIGEPRRGGGAALALSVLAAVARRRRRGVGRDP